MITNSCQLKTCKNNADFEITYSTGAANQQVIKICQRCFLDECNEEFRMFVLKKIPLRSSGMMSEAIV